MCKIYKYIRKQDSFHSKHLPSQILQVRMIASLNLKQIQSSTFYYRLFDLTSAFPTRARMSDESVM